MSVCCLCISNGRKRWTRTHAPHPNKLNRACIRLIFRTLQKKEKKKRGGSISVSVLTNAKWVCYSLFFVSSDWILSKKFQVPVCPPLFEKTDSLRYFTMYFPLFLPKSLLTNAKLGNVCFFINFAWILTNKFQVPVSPLQFEKKRSFVYSNMSFPSFLPKSVLSKLSKVYFLSNQTKYGLWSSKFLYFHYYWRKRFI